MRKKYNWIEVQEFYNNGNSWRDIIKYFGVSNRAIQKAIIRGDLVVRNKSDAQKLNIAKFGPNKMGDAARSKLSKLQSTKNRGGKSKWFKVSGQSVQGTWERDLAIKFNELGVNWIKLKLNSDVWEYIIDGKVKNYTPDFYLPDYDLYLDPKGYWWGNDFKKIEEVKKQHKDKKLLIIEKDLFNKLLNCTNDSFLQLIGFSGVAGCARGSEKPEDTVRSGGEA